ncbi:response regulator transcription factor [Streptomyces lavendulocolor]|uniref:response regulator transcription factor n=1 Tax=Streptomyces lavendulocolor TaxID=67316 RepID=UPI0033D8132D
MSATTQVRTLSSRERQVVQGLANGLIVPLIARQLGLSPQTVNSYCLAAKVKFNVRKAAALVHAAYEAGEIPEPASAPVAVPLPDGQRALLPLIAQGKSAPQMAAELARPVTDVRNDVRSMMSALGVEQQPHLITRARQLGLFGPNGPGPMAVVMHGGNE